MERKIIPFIPNRLVFAIPDIVIFIVGMALAGVAYLVVDPLIALFERIQMRREEKRNAFNNK